MRARTVILLLLIVAVLLGAAFVGFAWRSALDPIEPPSPSSFGAADVARGAQLAMAANCNVCHTAEDGAPYAGKRPLSTPFGTVYATNITPDPDTGIGRWSEAAFQRAMREGVDRRGRHLYPAFPYDHFTRMTDVDIKALYAFLMTRQAVRAEAPANDLVFPLNIRMSVAGWKALFLHSGPFEPDPARDATWNRGAYLVESVAHCGGCHTPRNLLGAEKRREALAGGESEGWHAPALDGSSTAPLPWTEEALHIYLRGGIPERRVVPGGPMLHVVRNFSGVPDEDVKAIARYIASLAPPATGERAQRTQRMLEAAKADMPGRLEEGRALHESACATCHHGRREGSLQSSGDALGLALASAVHQPTPRNLINLVVHGIEPADGEPGPWMPAFGTALSDREIAALARYLREGLAGAPAWRDLDEEVRAARKQATGN
jgi:mono/diheme cytochrome c family protein